MNARSIVVVVLALVALAAPAGAQVSTTQMELIGSPKFLQRIEYLASTQALVVKAEALATVCHVRRTEYASRVLLGEISIARMAAVVVGGINLLGTVTGVAPNATSSASDAAIFSQLASFWSALAGCDTGT